jgi:hypothetical protein
MLTRNQTIVTVVVALCVTAIIIALVAVEHL